MSNDNPYGGYPPTAAATGSAGRLRATAVSAPSQARPAGRLRPLRGCRRTGRGPGGPGGPGGPPPGYPPQYPGGLPPKKSRAKLAVIAGAAAIVLITGTTGIILANRNDTDVVGQQPPTTATSQPASTEPTPVGGPSSTVPSSDPPTGATASDAVNGYLQALARGDANAAIGYSAQPVVQGGTLSKGVLSRSIKLAPLTEIDVPAVDDPTPPRSTPRTGSAPRRSRNRSG